MPSLIQHAKFAFNATSSWNMAFGSAVTTNNRITTQLANSNTAVLSGVSDNAGGGSNTYNLDDTKSDATVGGQSNAESANITRGGGSALTVTASFTANQSGEGFIQEFSGLDTATNIVRTTGETVDTVGNTAHSATTGAASVSGDLVLGFDNGGASETSISAANSTTLIDSDLTSASATVWKTAGGTTETAGVTVAPSDTYIFMTVVLKQLAVALPLPPPARRRLFPWLKRRPPTFPYPQAVAAAAPAFVPPNPRRRYLIPTAHSRVMMVPAPITVAPPPLAYIPAGGRRRFFALMTRRSRPTMPLALSDVPLQSVRRRQQLPLRARRVTWVPLVDQLLLTVARRRPALMRIIRRRAEFPWFQAAALPPPPFVPSSARRLSRWLLIYRRGRFIGPPLFIFQILKKGKSLRPAAIVMTNPTRAPSLKPGSIPTVRPRRAASLRPASPPVLTDPREDT